MRPERRRVVVTGLGLVSALGNTVEESWSALVAGRGGARPISHFDATGFPVRIACEVAEFDVRDYLDRKTARRMDRCSHLVVAAARQAEADAHLDAAQLHALVAPGAQTVAVLVTFIQPNSEFCHVLYTLTINGVHQPGG